MYDLICLDAGGDCKYARFIPGHRSYGSNIPDNCQGCVFPGDEAHIECELIGEECCEDFCPILRGEEEDEDAYECCKDE